MRVPAVLCCLVLVVAGCGGLSTPAEPTLADDTTPTAEPVGPTVGTVTDVPPPRPAVEVSVTAVVDGDTIRVEYANGTRDTVRLVGVDTPEVHAENDPPEFEGVPDTTAGATCLREAGIDASNLAKDRLLGRTVGLAFDPNLDRRGYYDRLLAYVVVEDRLFNYGLVRSGHARVYDSDFTRKTAFDRAESEAREAGRGLWQCADGATAVADGGTVTAGASGLAITAIDYDAPGNDNENLNAESVTLTNRGDEALSLAGWTVSDDADHRYTFGDLTLTPGASVTLHTGSGTDTDSDVYWGREGAVWNNGGDTVTVRDAGGTVVVERSY
ncbi:lamin tail domain-containing protein [Haloarcula pelagica]|uniref:lamin tail domain-containing protein n=1 Tax=Haloarcula pelagica TaxID=3033389 RepID=UPI0024C46F38|nr:lamin tail domain-containing protein [Halomicroarcula sp. YJ-61-S]